MVVGSVMTSLVCQLKRAGVFSEPTNIYHDRCSRTIRAIIIFFPTYAKNESELYKPTQKMRRSFLTYAKLCLPGQKSLLTTSPLTSSPLSQSSSTNSVTR